MRDATSSQCTLQEASQAGCRPSFIIGHELFSENLSILFRIMPISRHARLIRGLRWLRNDAGIVVLDSSHDPTPRGAGQGQRMG